jgi:hypothetical protein
MAKQQQQKKERPPTTCEACGSDAREELAVMSVQELEPGKALEKVRMRCTECSQIRIDRFTVDVAGGNPRPRG